MYLLLVKLILLSFTNSILYYKYVGFYTRSLIEAFVSVKLVKLIPLSLTNSILYYKYVGFYTRSLIEAFVSVTGKTDTVVTY